MAAKKVGELIKEARTAKGLSQAKLAEEVEGLSSTDIGKAERAEKELTQAQLKAIAKVLGVTQKSLLEAPSGVKAQASGVGKPSGKTSAKTGAATKKETSSGGTSVKVTATEKKLLELYRAADSDTKKSVMNLLKGESSTASELVSSLLGNVVNQYLKK